LNSEGPNERDLGPFELLTLGPGPSLPNINLPSSILTLEFWCDESGDTSTGDISKKRTKKEIGKFGRNIKQRLLCGLFDWETNQIQDASDQGTSSNVEKIVGLREAGLEQLPSNHENLELES